MPAAIDLWWGALCVLAATNLLLWGLVARRTWLERDSVDAHDRALRRALLLLAAGYAAGCAWRSVLPVYDVPRQVMVDSFASSVLVGRSVATAAELCFATQWALLLRAASRVTGQRSVALASRVLLPLIVLAETFSWYSVLSTSNVGHAVEESLWCAGALLVGAALWRVRPQVSVAARRWATCAAAAGGLYAAYLAGVDVPMYWERWVQQSLAGQVPLGLGEGLVDAATRRTVSRGWADWRSEVDWMTAYFSIGVWCSLALVRWPAWRGSAPQATSTAPIAVRGWSASAQTNWSAKAR
jgi:hypothetical protein